MGLMGFLSAIGFFATAAASGWKDCGGDWTGCCKQDVKYNASKVLVRFTNVTELNSRGEADLVHLDDPFFTIEVQGKSVTSEEISNITVQIRGYWSLSSEGPWLRYVNVRRDLCSDPDIVVKKGLCPMTREATIDKKVKHRKLSKFTPGGFYKSIETWWHNDEPIGCVDTGIWRLVRDMRPATVVV